MKLWSTNADGTRRLLGVPVAVPWDRPATVVLRCFEPENPALFVPRSIFGAGWDLNFGAVAVKLGLIRPDDSLPDLGPYIPETMRRFLGIAPVVGAVGSVVAAAGLIGEQKVATKWSLSCRPKKYSNGTVAAALFAGLAVGAATLPYVTSESGDDSADESDIQSVDADYAAQALSIQSMSVLSAFAARREVQHRGERQPLVGLMVISIPTVAGGVLVATVKSALGGVQKSLTHQNSSCEDENKTA